MRYQLVMQRVSWRSKLSNTKIRFTVILKSPDNLWIVRAFLFLWFLAPSVTGWVWRPDPSAGKVMDFLIGAWDSGKMLMTPGLRLIVILAGIMILLITSYASRINMRVM